MSAFKKIKHSVKNMFKGSDNNEESIFIGTHNVTKGLRGINNLDELHKHREKKKKERKLEIRVSRRLFDPAEYYFICSLTKKQFGPELLAEKPPLEDLEELAKKYMIRCQECGRWVEPECWDTARGECKVCIEEERILTSRSSPKREAVEVKKQPEKDETVKKAIPEKCPNCGYPIRESEINWVGENKFQCSSCGNEMKIGNTADE
ncbi:MAG: hypothetical protein ACTSUV_03265 [Candidatus Ranarchaeia archaeon]